MKLKTTFDKADINFITKPKEDPIPEPVSVDDVLIHDKQPKKLKEVFGDKGSTWARVTQVDLENGTRYARLNYLRKGDFQDFDCRTLAQRIKDGSLVQVSTDQEKWQIIQLISDTLWTTNPDAAASLNALVREYGDEVSTRDDQMSEV